MTREEALKLAEDYKKDKHALEIIDLLLPFYKQSKTIDLACFLIYAYRRLGDYPECYKICDEMDSAAGRPGRIRLQRLWTDVFKNVIGENNLEQASRSAENLLASLNPENGYDFSIHKFICFAMSDKMGAGNIQGAIDWLKKIKASKLSNKAIYNVRDDEGSYNNEERRSHSPKYLYYSKLARILRLKGNLMDSVSLLMSNFSQDARLRFIDALRLKVSEDTFVSNLILSRILMTFREEAQIQSNSVEHQMGNFTVSDVASYTFCPASAAINKSVAYITEQVALEYDDEMSFSRKYLNDIYEIIKNKGLSLQEAYSEMLANGFSFHPDQKALLERIFRANRIGQNVPNSIFMSQIFQNKGISGSPDMVLEDYERYIVEEVYTSSPTSTLSHPYENDCTKVAGYLTEMNINTAYLFYWNTRSEASSDIKKRTSKITGLRIFKIENNPQLRNDYISKKDAAAKLINEKQMAFNPSQINYNKCVNCGVAIYCRHKWGHLNTIKIPYKLNYA